MLRLNNRAANELRQVKITRNFTKYSSGCVLIEVGETKVLCTASIEEKLPPFLLNKNQGWLTAEYAMLPSATHSRNKRDAVVGKVNSRAQEISRLIGRSLRACLDLKELGPRQIIIDCDVLQADGGTRTASITGAFVALYDAINYLLLNKMIDRTPIKHFLAAVSVGVIKQRCYLDLDYLEDSSCDVDMNFILLDNGSIVEIQGAAEHESFDRLTLNKLLDLAEYGVSELIIKQRHALNLY